MIEPFPEERLMALLRPGDDEAVKLIRSPVQDFPLAEFDPLGTNDVPFHRLITSG